MRQRLRAALAALVCLLGVIYAIPTFLTPEYMKKLPSWFPKEKVSLGLDLQGGSHLLLEVDIESALKDHYANLGAEVKKTLFKHKKNFQAVSSHEKYVAILMKSKSDFPTYLKHLQETFPDCDIKAYKEKITLTMNEKALMKYRQDLVSQSIEIVQRRINELGTREPNVQKQGKGRIIVQLPGVKDPDVVKDILGRTAKLTFRMVEGSGTDPFSKDLASPPGTLSLESQDGHHTFYRVKNRVEISGEDLADASASFDENRDPQVSFRLTHKGARKFGDITQNNIGKPFAIILDQKVISAPIIRSPILGGSGVIQGRFTLEEANNLALLMRAGALPAPINIIEERTVGPDLGSDAILAGEKATIVSLVLVVAFMALAYTYFGVVANVALFFNLILLVAALAATGSTLTLPGIAGIALTLGMAVDANVLIFERIKEELRAGHIPERALDLGYNKALATIFDSNITTLIAAISLYVFGSGPIKGFGVTLAIGITISMFTAITLTRTLIQGLVCIKGWSFMMKKEKPCSE